MRSLRISTLLRRHVAVRPDHQRSLSSPATLSPVLDALAKHDPQKKAVSDSLDSHTYHSLISSVQSLQTQIPKAPVAIFLPPDRTFVQSLLAVWAAGGIPVPLSPLYPAAALSPLLDTVQPSRVISSSTLRHGLPPTKRDIITIDPAAQSSPVDDYHATCNSLAANVSEKAMIFFTSGTTGNPKGVVWTQQMLRYQLETLSKAWQWSPHDRVLNVLPLHHIHGLVNVVLSALFNGAHLLMHTAFDAHSVWHEFLSPHPPTVFMAVPAIYKKLIMHYDAVSERQRASLRAAARDVRLFVCGSASLPRADYERWSEISGQKILERYGMTETGMTLSNPYHDRHSGLLGVPLPGVETNIVDGELRVKGPGVFNEYWGLPKVTSESFIDGWFSTGDVVEIDNDTGYYRLLGRASADIIKTGGYKVSALEIEEVLRTCPGVIDCSVVGAPDEVLGQRVIAAVVFEDNTALSALQKMAEEMLPRYKVPREYHVVDGFPRNVLGKVQKQVLKVKLGIGESHF